MTQINIDDIKHIAIGASLLGAGGGGNPYVGTLMAISAVREKGPVQLIDPTDVPEDALVISASMVGAPAVSLEKFPNGNEYDKAFPLLEETYGQKAYATYPIEAGGINSMIPIMVAARRGLPLVDVDGMGRAFPELQMTTFAIAGHPVTPIVITDERGNNALVNTVDANWAEKIIRTITVKMGATSSVAGDAVHGKDLVADGVTGIISLSKQIGELIDSANDFDTVDAALKQLLKITNGYKLFTGKITDINHTTKDGFNFGEVTIEGFGKFEQNFGSVSFQNENIIFKVNDQVLATAPDLITLVDVDTLIPVTNEELRYGKRVNVLGLPANPKWRTEIGITTVGPRYFGYDIDYVPLEQLVEKYQRWENKK